MSPVAGHRGELCPWWVELDINTQTLTCPSPHASFFLFHCPLFLSPPQHIATPDFLDKKLYPKVSFFAKRPQPAPRVRRRVRQQGKMFHAEGLQGKAPEHFSDRPTWSQRLSSSPRLSKLFLRFLLLLFFLCQKKKNESLITCTLPGTLSDSPKC